MSRIGHEIVELESRVKGLRDNYYIVDVLGSGTFSSVYKAIDLRNSQYDNEEWIESYARSMASGALPAYMSHAMDKDQSGTGTTQPRYLRASDVYRRTGRPVYVALKRIFVTSSPARILNELDILVALRDGPNVSHLITAWRSQDQVMVVMPLVRHEDFRHFHRILPMSEMRYYFHSLLTALQWCHSQDVIHRDVKPTNFLYNPTTATGTLCDFGLAEIFDPNSWQGACHHGPPTLDHPHGLTGVNSETESTHFWPNAMLHANSRTPTAENKIGGYPAQTFQHLHANIAVSHGGLPIPGYIKKETRPSVHAERAGTRGFRPPEVLLKCPDQTVAIDIWAVGVIMLAFLTKRYPLFNARDDQEALLEISTIFGKRRMEQVAVLHSAFFCAFLLLLLSCSYRKLIKHFALLRSYLYYQRTDRREELHDQHTRLHPLAQSLLGGHERCTQPGRAPTSRRRCDRVGAQLPAARLHSPLDR